MVDYAAAIFDLDGTLIDTERPVIAAGLQILQDWGHDVSHEFMISLVGIDVNEGHRRLCAHLGTEIDRARFDAAWRERAKAEMASGIPLMPGVDALLPMLAARGLPRAVATNTGTARAREKVQQAGLSPWFEAAHVVGFDSVARPKPAADVYLAAAERLGVAPERCVAFEDSDTGVAAALAAGMVVVQIPDMLPAAGRDAHHLAESLIDGARACGLI